MKRAAIKKGYTARDIRAVSDNPEWTKDDFARAQTFDEVFPGMPKRRGSKVVKRKRTSAAG
jgi:hypothetical protein